MTTTYHNDAMELKALKSRYKDMKGVDLSEEQAVTMLKFEQEKNSGSSKFHLSVWEEFDYDESKLKEILTPFQFEEYLSKRDEQLKFMQEQLMYNDLRYLPLLDAVKEQLVYYKDILVPAIQKNTPLFIKVFSPDKEKVDFLKAEYKKFLVDTRMKTLIEHFRHSKTFQPTLLKLSLLSFEEMCLYPNYYRFQGSMDTVTKTVADYVQQKLARVSDQLLDPLKPTLDALHTFKTNNAKQLCEDGGWETTILTTDKTEELMNVVLFDPDKYV